MYYFYVLSFLLCMQISQCLAVSGIPGDIKLFRKEIACISAYAKNPDNNYVNYFPAIGSPEHTDSIHSGVQPCATVTSRNKQRLSLGFVSRYLSASPACF